MQSEIIANVFDEIRVMDPVDIDPGNGFGILEGNTFGNTLQLQFLYLAWIVVDYPYSRKVDLFRADKGQRAWCLTDTGILFFEKPRHGYFPPHELKVCLLRKT